MEFLVRKHTKNGDKSNKLTDSIEDAFKQIGRGIQQTDTIVGWLNYVDIYFKGTNDYIRVIN